MVVKEDSRGEIWYIIEWNPDKLGIIYSTLNLSRHAVVQIV